MYGCFNVTIFPVFSGVDLAGCEDDRPSTGDKTLLAPRNDFGILKNTLQIDIKLCELGILSLMKKKFHKIQLFLLSLI